MRTATAGCCAATTRSRELLGCGPANSSDGRIDGADLRRGRAADGGEARPPVARRGRVRRRREALPPLRRQRPLGADHHGAGPRRRRRARSARSNSCATSRCASAMEADLLENQTLLEAIIANLPVALLASDATGRHHALQRARPPSCSASRRPPLVAGPAPRAHPLKGDVFLPTGVTPVDRGAAAARPRAARRDDQRPRTRDRAGRFQRRARR